MDATTSLLPVSRTCVGTEISFALTDDAFLLSTLLITIQVTLATKELSGQDLTKFYGDINGIIKVLLQSADSEDKLCGVLIIGRQGMTHRTARPLFIEMCPVFLEKRSIDQLTRPLLSYLLDNLIGIEDEDNTAQETRFANYLRQLFPSDVPIMTVAARALGTLAEISCFDNMCSTY